jgi:hypothetical protein
MTVRWKPDECSKIWDIIIQACKVHNLTKEYAFETFHEFIQRPRRHSSFVEAWKEYLEETSSEDVEAQEGESTESVTTQIELTSISNKSEGFEADKVIEETLEILLDGFVEETPSPPLERVIANSIDDLEEEWEKEIEICLCHLESCKEETKPHVIESVLALEEKEDSKEETVETPENEEEAYHEEEDKEEDQDKLLPNYDFQLKNILDEYLSSNQGSFDGFEVECRNLVEKAVECEKLVEMEMQQHVVVGKEENFLQEKSNGMKEPSKVRNVDLYGTPESQPTTIQEKDLLQRNDISNKADAKTEIDKVIDMICALFATIKLKRIWKQHSLFLKFMEFLPNRQKKNDDMFSLTYMPP